MSVPVIETDDKKDHQAEQANGEVMNYSRFMNAISLARQASPIRLITALLIKSKPSVISLAGGNPNPSLFPFQQAEFKLRDGTVLQLSEQQMNVALQYGPTEGMADLVNFLKKLQKTLHNPPTMNVMPKEGGLDICVTLGSADAICKSFEMLITPGDSILIEEPTYAGTLAAIRPLGGNILTVETDHQGMIPSALRAVLSKFQRHKVRPAGSTTPKLLYTIPNGCNPTGGSLTLERKKEIYEIAREYDLLILEDDPYYFLQFSKPRVPTYLSLDVDGRVLRFDSFSKIMSSGLRVGFLSGPQAFVQRVIYHQMVSAVHTPGLSQMMMSELFKRWDIEGLEEHTDRVVEFYRKQKDVMIKSAEKWLTGLAEWSEPKAGMFLWMKLLGITDSKKLIEERALEKEVLFVPGYAFMLNPDEPTPYVRASFSLASPEKIDIGIQRLAELLKEERNKNKQ